MYIVISHTLVFHMDVMFRNKVIEFYLISYVQLNGQSWLTPNKQTLTNF